MVDRPGLLCTAFFTQPHPHARALLLLPLAASHDDDICPSLPARPMPFLSYIIPKDCCHLLLLLLLLHDLPPSLLRTKPTPFAPPSQKKKPQRRPIKSPSSPPPRGSRSRHSSFVYSALAVDRPAPPDCDSALRPAGAFQDHHHHLYSTSLASLCSAWDASAPFCQSARLLLCLPSGCSGAWLGGAPPGRPSITDS